MSVFKRAETYTRAHWKELLALSLAAIPAAFLVFHKGAQKAAANAITYIPAAFGAPASDSVGSPLPAPAASMPCPVGFHSVLGVCVPDRDATNQSPPNPPPSRDGANPINSPPLPRSVLGSGYSSRAGMAGAR